MAIGNWQLVIGNWQCSFKEKLPIANLIRGETDLAMEIKE